MAAIFMCRASGQLGSSVFFEFTGHVPAVIGSGATPMVLFQKELILHPLPEGKSPVELVGITASSDIDEVTEGFGRIVREHYQRGFSFPSMSALDEVVSGEAEGIWNALCISSRLIGVG